MYSPSNGQFLGLFKVIGDAISNVLSSLFGKVLQAIITPYVNYIKTLYYFLCKTIYSAFLLPVARVIDICQLIFRKFAGIDTMNIKNLNRSQIFGSAFQSDDIVTNLISSDIVQRIFFAMLILAVVLLIVTTFVANIKSEFNAQDKGGNNKRKVFKNAFRGLLNFVAVPVVSLFAIFLSNGLLKAIDGATQINGSQTYLSGQLFVASAYNANRARTSQDNEKGNGYYKTNSFGALITGNYDTGVQDGTGYANFGIFLDDANQYGYRAADKIDNAFATGLNLKVEESTKPYMLYYGNKLYFWYGGMDIVTSSISMLATQGGKTPGGYTTFPEGYKMSYGAFGDIKGTFNPLSIFGIGEGFYYELNYASNKGVDADYGHISFSIYDTALVFYYYDLGLSNFSYIIYIIAGSYFCYALLVTAIGLIKRLFMVTTLFIISPPVCALYPMDEGQALGRWRKAFVSEVTSAYAVIVVMNIFLSLLPLFTSIEVFSINSMSSRFLQLFPLYTWWIDPFIFEQGGTGYGSETISEAYAGIGTALSPVIGFLNAFARLLIIIGGLHFFKKATKQIAEVLGTGNAMEDGAEVAAKIGKTISGAATLAVGAMTAGAGAAAVKGAQAAGKGAQAANAVKGAGAGAAKGEGGAPDVQPNPEKSITNGGSSPESGGTPSGGSPDSSMGFADWDALREEASHIPVKFTKSGKVDGRTKLGKMLKQKGLDGMPVKLTKTGSIDGRSKLGKQLAGMKTLKTKPSGATGATPAPSPTSAGSGSGGSTPSGIPSTPDAPKLTDRKDQTPTKTPRNAWQKFTKFSNTTKMLYDVATGKSGATQTAAAMEKNFDNPNIKPYKDKDAEKRKNLEGKIQELMQKRNDLALKNSNIAKQIKALPKGSPKAVKLIEEIEKNNIEISVLDENITDRKSVV